MKLVLVALGVACLLAVSIPIALGGDATPTWQLKTYISRGVDRSFKADVYEEMPRVPRVLVFGGSRSLRMDPATIKQKTGLTAFNFGFHNGRPEDAWAVTDWVIDSHPDKPPAVIWCLQATTLADVPMNPGLIVDERFSQAFPKALVDAKMGWAMKQHKRNILSGRRFGYDGMLWWNGYDTKRQAGLTLQQALDGYLDADMLAKAGNGRRPHNTRAMAYFVQTIRLLNKNHIKPLIVIMPYQPAGAERVPLGGLGRQGAVAAQLPLQAVEAPGLQGARLPAHQHLRGLAGRVLRRRAPHGGELAPAHPLLHRARAGLLQAAEAAAARARVRRRARVAESVAERERRAGAGPGAGVHAGARGHERAGGLPRVIRGAPGRRLRRRSAS